MVSPRTRNVPRVNARSLRVYWMVDQLAQQLVPLDLLADVQPDHAVDVLLRGAQAVDAGDGGDHDHVAAGEQRVGGRVPQPLDLVVDRRVLLDVGVRLRDVRLGLVVVVVGDEVLHRVVRQQLAELVGQLRGQRLVRRHHQGRALQPLDQPGGRGGLAGAGGAEQHDVAARRPGCALSRSSIAAGWSPEGGEVADDLEDALGRDDVGDGAHDLTISAAADSFFPGA